MAPFFVKGEHIILKRDGTWMADGVEITHGETRDLFSRSIHWDAAEKKYYLEVGYERIFIEVEDTPYFVCAVERVGEARRVRLSSFIDVDIRADRLRYENGSLYLELDDGQRAKFLSAAYYDLLRDLQEDVHAYFLIIAGTRVDLSAKTEDPRQGRRGARA